jgi:hypothetical protein
MITHFLGIDIGVKMTYRIASVKKKAIYFIIPSSRRLLKAVEIFLKVEGKAIVILNIDTRLFNVNFYL